MQKKKNENPAKSAVEKKKREETNSNCKAFSVTR